MNFLEIDLIPGTTDKTLVLNDLHRVMRGRNYVIVRMIGIKGNVIKGVLEVENCAERTNHMIFTKLAQITNEAQIEVGFVRMEIERIDVTNNALNPIMLIGLMWKARWVAVQGLHIDMNTENKTEIVKEIMKSLDFLNEKEMVDGDFDTKIRYGIESKTNVNDAIRTAVNIHIIELPKEINVSWDKGYSDAPNNKIIKIIKSERKVSYVEKLLVKVRDLSTKKNFRGEYTEINPIVITLLRDDEVYEFSRGQNMMVVGGFTKNDGSMAMAERTNMIMIMTSIGLDMKKIMMNGNLISIEGYVLTFVSMERKIGDKLRYELVLIIIADTFDKMKIVRDHILEIKEPKESRVDKWDIVDNYGVKYFYVSTYEKALLLHDTPDTYKGVRSIAMYNLNENPSTINIYEEISKYVNGNVLNMQFEDQRDKNNEMTIDSQQKARRAYAYMGKLEVDITTEMISGMKKYMHYEKEIIDINVKNKSLMTNY